MVLFLRCLRCANATDSHGLLTALILYSNIIHSKSENSLSKIKTTVGHLEDMPKFDSKDV